MARIEKNKLAQLKKQAFELSKQGLSSKEISNEIGISISSISKWFRLANAENVLQIENKKLLEKKLNELLHNPKSKPLEIQSLVNSLDKLNTMQKIV